MYKGLLVVLIVVSLILFYLASKFTIPLEMCDAEISLLNVSVELYDGKRIDPIKVEFPVKEPIEVKPDEEITLIAEIEPRPEGCNGPLLVSWRRPFASDSSRDEFISEASRHEVLKITVSTQVPKDYSEGQITVAIIRILSGTKEQMQNLRFKVLKGE